MKFIGLKDFKYVYITNGITKAIHTTMIEHSLRPIVQKNEYHFIWHQKFLEKMV